MVIILYFLFFLIFLQKRNLNENKDKKLESIEQGLNLSNENSFQSHGSKNFILKSDFLENTNNISKEENFNNSSNRFN